MKSPICVFSLSTKVSAPPRNFKKKPRSWQKIDYSKSTSFVIPAQAGIYEVVLRLCCEDSDKIIAGDKPVLVDFFATWCGPCQVMEPILESLTERYPQIDEVEIVKADIDVVGEIAAKYNIMSVPTLVIFKQGKIAEKMVGLQTEEELETKLTNQLK